MSIAVIAGLGNPGISYAQTRHNVGFEVLDALAVKHSIHPWKSDKRSQAEVCDIEINGKKVTLLKPAVNMNDNGKSIGAFCRYRDIDTHSLVVVHDDITMKTCMPKISLFGGSGGHNGVEDIFQHFGKGFVRYRIGIGQKPDPRTDLAAYVLSKFKGMELQLFESRVPKYVSDIELIIDKGVVPAMNLVNRKNKPESK